MSILGRVAGLSKPRSRKRILACLLLPALLLPAWPQDLPVDQEPASGHAGRAERRHTRNRLPSSCSSW